MNDEKETRISWSTGYLMILTAFLYDLTQALLVFVPFVGWLLNYLLLFYVFLTFNVIWFHIVGVRFSEQLLGKVGRGVSQWVIGKWLFAVMLEIFTFGFIPGITLWIAWTIGSVKTIDKMITEGIITRAQVDLIDQSLRRMYKKHGGNTPEFRQAVAKALKKEGTERINKKIEGARVNLQNRTYSELEKRGLSRKILRHTQMPRRSNNSEDLQERQDLDGPVTENEEKLAA